MQEVDEIIKTYRTYLANQVSAGEISKETYKKLLNEPIMGLHIYTTEDGHTLASVDNKKILF